MPKINLTTRKLQVADFNKISKGKAHHLDFNVIPKGKAILPQIANTGFPVNIAKAQIPDFNSIPKGKAVLPKIDTADLPVFKHVKTPKSKPKNIIFKI